MPVTTVTITNVPTFGGRGIGYQFSGTISLSSVITAPIRINSMSLYYGYGRVYVSAPYLTAVCGDTTFRTDQFSLGEDSSLKERTMNVLTWNAGTNHILSQNGRTITFTAQRGNSTSANLIDRPRSGDMVLTIDYTILFQASTFTLGSSSVTMGNSVTLNIASNTLNSGFSHTAKITLGNQSVTASRTGPGALTVSIPANSSWYATLPSSSSGAGSVVLTTTGNGETGTTSSSVTIHIPSSIVPTAGSLSFTPSKQQWGLYVQGISTVTAVVSGYAAGSGASISSVSVSGNGVVSNSASLSSGVLRNSGTVTFTAKITDTRGRTSSVTNSITVTAYSRPSLSSMVLTRRTSAGTSDQNGTYVKIDLGYNWSQIGSNAITADVYIDGAVKATYQTLPLNGVYGDGELDPTKSQNIQVSLQDEIYTRSQTGSSISATLQSAARIINLYPSITSGIGIGKVAEIEKCVEFAEGWKLLIEGADIGTKLAEAESIAQAAKTAAENAQTSADLGGPLNIYPVGAIYLSYSSTSPASLFGGTWLQLPDRFLVGAGSTYGVGATGGSSTVSLTVAQLPSHNHGFLDYWQTYKGSSSDKRSAVAVNGDGAGLDDSGANARSYTANTGSGSAHENRPPYLAVYMWRRTA